MFNLLFSQEILNIAILFSPAKYGTFIQLDARLISNA
jgi:hypothetical protein